MNGDRPETERKLVDDGDFESERNLVNQIAKMTRDPRQRAEPFKSTISNINPELMDNVLSKGNLLP